MKMKSPYLVKPGVKVKLSSFSTDDTDRFGSEKDAAEQLEKDQGALDELQQVLYASQKKAILLVLQGMDTAGKDGTIRHIFSGINPQGCQVASFKVPTPLEQRHDFLWRCEAQLPPKGNIGIFNRSHYEEVLSPRVHGRLSKKQVAQHLDSINAWEGILADSNVVILKVFLHISRKEQTERLQARIDDPSKHWKLSPADFEERPYWPDYMKAYEEIFERTSHKHAPWFIVPADHKWYRNVVVSGLLRQAMEGLKLEYPKSEFDASGIELDDESAKAAADEVRVRVAKG